MKNNKKIIAAIAGITILYFIMKTKKPFSKIVPNQKLRVEDPYGEGRFGAPRGNYAHKGIDIVTTPGESIFSPIDGKVSRHSIAYNGDTYKLIEIINESYKIKLMYLTPTAPIGAVVKKGEPVAISQNIALRYGPTMLPHIHFQAYKKQGNNWVLIDPTNLFE